MGSADGLNPELMRRFSALQAAARAAGTSIGIGSGLRSVDEQARLRVKNGCPDVWTSPASSCRVPTAIPGRSNHNHGLAIDITGDKAWANANAAKFGLHFPVPGEDWHIEMIDDDGSREYVQGAQQGGAIGFNVNWLESPVSAEEKQDQLIASYMGVITGAQRDALLATPGSDPMLATPEPAEVATPAGAAEGQSSSPLESPAQLTMERTIVPPQVGQGVGAPPAGGGNPGTGDQLSNARIIAQVGRSMGASDQQIKIALAAALVESNLKNVNYGDRDSLGLFQQRPSQGWGSPEQVMNPQYAATKFFQGLMSLNPSKYGSPGSMAQAVQRSAYPGRYDERWGQANTIFSQLGGG